MKKFLFLIMTVLAIQVSAQTTVNPKFTDLDHAKIASMMLVYAPGKDIMSGTSAALIANDSISTTQNKELNPYKEFIIESFGNMSDLKFADSPFKPALIKYSGGDCLIFKNTLSQNVYNNAKIDSKERAILVFNDVLKAAISNIGKSKAKAPQHIGILVVYKSKDFTEEFDSGDYESILAIVPFKTAKSFYTLDITEDEVLEKSNIILYKFKDILRSVRLKY